MDFCMWGVENYFIVFLLISILERKMTAMLGNLVLAICSH